MTENTLTSGLKTSDSLLYPIADALYIDLFDMGDKYRGFKELDLKVGPWVIKADVSLVSDRLSDNTATFFAKIVGSLWLYLVSKGSMGLSAYVLDGEVLKLHVKDIGSFGKVTVTDALNKLRKGLITAYAFNEETKEWEERVDLLDYSTIDKSSKPSGTSAKKFPGPEV